MTIPPDQQAAADFLRTLAGAAPIETHISAVFVTSDAVYKLKKSIRLPFLDFTAIAERERLLRRELDLNRPAAPGLYRGVLAIARDPSGTIGLTATPATAPLDWVLHMARVPPEDFLDTVARDRRLTPDLLDELADVVAAYHADCPIHDRDPLAAMRQVAQGNAEAATHAGLPAAATKAWLQQTLAALDGLTGWFAARRNDRFVRRAHGDLHLGNLCLWRGHPIAFDALEFDESMATIDLGYDLAFLLMDLDQRVDRASANRVLNRYIGRTGDAGLAAALAPFLSLRAMIRAHVRKAAGKPEFGQPGWETYLKAAADYLAPGRPLLLAIGGLQGSGKSTVARRLAPFLGAAPGAVILRSDEIRKRLHRVAPEQRLPASAYSAATNAMVDATLVVESTRLIRAGRTVIADATFLDLTLRRRLEQAARDADVPFIGCWLEVPLKNLERRVEARLNDASDATLAVLQRAAAQSPGAGSWHRIPAHDGEAAAKRIRRMVDQPREKPVVR